MDDDERRRRMCTGKDRHKDEAAAEQAIRLSEASFLRAYRCDYCDRWHLTSQDRR